MTKKEKTAKCEPLDSQTDDSSLSSATKEAKSTKQVSAQHTWKAVSLLASKWTLKVRKVVQVVKLLQSKTSDSQLVRYALLTLTCWSSRAAISLLKVTERSRTQPAPRLWNNLPLAKRITDSQNIFKKQLKTLLFKRAFSL